MAHSTTRCVAQPRQRQRGQEFLGERVVKRNRAFLADLVASAIAVGRRRHCETSPGKVSAERKSAPLEKEQQNERTAIRPRRRRR
eukprot:3943338-Prymnesium_polylepis.2